MNAGLGGGRNLREESASRTISTGTSNQIPTPKRRTISRDSTGRRSFYASAPIQNIIQPGLERSVDSPASLDPLDRRASPPATQAEGGLAKKAQTSAADSRIAEINAKKAEQLQSPTSRLARAKTATNISRAIGSPAAREAANPRRSPSSLGCQRLPASLARVVSAPMRVAARRGGAAGTGGGRGGGGY